MNTVDPFERAPHGNGTPSESAPKIAVAVAPKRPLELGDLVSPRMRMNQSGFVTSFVFHLVMLFVLSAFILQAGSGKPLISLELQPDVAEQTKEVQIEPIETQIEFQEEIDTNTEFISFESNESGSAAKTKEQSLTPEILDLMSLTMNRSREDSLRDNLRRDKLEGGAATSFYGTQIEGDRFVFVIDCSTSMHWKAANGSPRFDLARDELMNSINMLTDQKEFYVFLFSNSAIRMFRGQARVMRPLKATEENKYRFKSWLACQTTSGGTKPQEALSLALKLAPDAVIILSDGAFKPLVSKELISEYKESRIPIHGFAFEDIEAQDNLRELAHHTNGAFQFVRIENDYEVAPHSPFDKLLRTNLSWKDRYEIAAQFLIPELGDDEPFVRELANDSLHQLAFDLFRSEFGSNLSSTSEDGTPGIGFTFENAADLQKPWIEIWDAEDAGIPAVDGYDGFERRTFHIMSNYRTRHDLDEIWNEVESGLSVEQQIILLRAMVSFQIQRGTSQQSRWIAGSLIRSLQCVPMAITETANAEEFEQVVNDLFNLRSVHAKTLYSQFRMLPVGSFERDLLGKELLDSFPETESARLLRQTLPTGGNQ